MTETADPRMLVVALVSTNPADAGDGATRTIGSGILIDAELAFIELAGGRTADDLVLQDLEVVVAPTSPQRGDRIERIRPTKINVGRLTDDERSIAAVVLASPSVRDGVEPYASDDVARGISVAGGFLEGFQHLGLVPSLPPRGQDLEDHLDLAADVLADFAPARVVDFGPMSAEEFGRRCCRCSPKCIPIDPDPGPGPDPEIP